jgi:hypothetical protein
LPVFLANSRQAKQTRPLGYGQGLETYLPQNLQRRSGASDGIGERMLETLFFAEETNAACY